MHVDIFIVDFSCIYLDKIEEATLQIVQNFICIVFYMFSRSESIIFIMFEIIYFVTFHDMLKQN